MIDALKILKTEEKIDLPRIKKLSIGGPKISVTRQMVYTPKSIMAAQYSLPFVTAIGVLRDVEDPNFFHEQILKDKEILSLAEKVTGFEDPEMEKVFPEKFASKVIVEYKDGA